MTTANKIVQITPAVDWYWKHDATVWNVAVFALYDDGSIVGKIGAGDNGALTSLPPLKGMYLHRNQLTPEEIKLADDKR